MTSDMISADIYIFYLTASRARPSHLPGDQLHPGGTRLAPVVDIRIESEAVSTDMVAAGYSCCVQMKGTGGLARGVNMSGSSGAGARYLWFRRAISQTEARSHGITGLKVRWGGVERGRPQTQPF